MNVPLQTPASPKLEPPVPTAEEPSARLAQPGARFALFGLVLAICFWQPLIGLLRYATHSDLYSHVLLMPFITFYLIWVQRRDPRVPAPTLPAQRSTLPALLPLLLGTACLVFLWVWQARGGTPLRDDYLCLTVLAFLLFLLAGGFVFWGSERLKAHAFPLAMLLFMVPFPAAVKNGIEFFFQHTSADAASFLFHLCGTPLYRVGLDFHLPGFSIRVAEECSGIRSSLVLFITGLLAAHLFLRTPWKKTVLALVVIPLGIVRNGFRIFTIGMLCVHVSPAMIDSPIHHRGGPIFFVLSLIPFFAILMLLRKSEPKP